MKKLCFLLLYLGCASCLRAQITVPPATLPALGDVLHYGVAQNQANNSMITPPGFGISWDFSGLFTNLTYGEGYWSPAQGQFAAKFPTANLLVVENDEERYYQVTAAGLDLLGYTEKQLFGYPFTVLYQLHSAYRERIAPLNFFDVHATSTASISGFKFSELPPGLQAAYLAAGVNADSIRLRTSRSKIFSVDASGTLTIPGIDPKPVYNVLRQKHTEYRERRVDAKVAPLGWLDITDITIQYVPGAISQLAIDTLGMHRFFDAVSKEIIFSFSIDAKGRPSGDVRYKNNLPVPCQWTGALNNNWGESANWSCAKVPGAADEVIIAYGTVIVTGAVTVKKLTVSSGAQVNVSSGSLTVLE